MTATAPQEVVKVRGRRGVYVRRSTSADGTVVVYGPMIHDPKADRWVRAPKARCAFVNAPADHLTEVAA